ncbi:MAG: hypothetical protein LQ343_005515 [Gyalolechia ehrenbergii]|nr:MAG: hypothetical protein LQ343_005515 [Gyalolechia ehrenbergii]
MADGLRYPPARPEPWDILPAPFVNFGDLAEVRKYLKEEWEGVLCTAHGALPSCSGEEPTEFLDYHWLWRAYRKVEMPHSETRTEFNQHYLSDYLGQYLIQEGNFWDSYLRFLQEKKDSGHVLDKWAKSQVKRFERKQMRGKTEEEEEEERGYEAEKATLIASMTQLQEEWNEMREAREAEQAAQDTDDDDSDDSDDDQNPTEGAESKESLNALEGETAVATQDEEMAPVPDTEASAQDSAATVPNTNADASVKRQDEGPVVHGRDLGLSVERGNEGTEHEDQEDEADDDTEVQPAPGSKRRSTRIANLAAKKARHS